MPLDIKKEFIKLKKEKARLRVAGIIMSSVGMLLSVVVMYIYPLIVFVFMVAAVIGFILIMRSCFHYNYRRLKFFISACDKCQQLNMIPPIGKNAELDEKIKCLEKTFFAKGNALLDGKLLVDDMDAEKLVAVTKVIENLDEIDKATDDALFMCYAHVTAVSKIRGAIVKNKQAPILKECVFRILYLRYYHLLNE